MLNPLRAIASVNWVSRVVNAKSPGCRTRVTLALDLCRAHTMPRMDYLAFDIAEVADDLLSLEAMASTAFEQHGLVMAEVQQVLDWAWQTFPHAKGPADHGMDWDHDLQVAVEPGGWHTVTLTLTGTRYFVDEFVVRFGPAAD